jgi:hypothetical protein
MSNKIDIQNAIAMLHSEGYEIVPPKPKEWEIQSFRGMLKDNSGLFTLGKDGTYYHDAWKDSGITGLALDCMLDSAIGSIVINSVKRLSDGEVFTVGDYSNWGIIKVFEIDFEKKLRVLYDKVGDWQYINSISHPPKKEQPKEVDTFQWTDELVNEFVVNEFNKDNDRMCDRINHFKQSKSTPKDKAIEWKWGSARNIGTKFYGFDGIMFNGKDYIDEKAVTEWFLKTLLEAEEKAFNAARELSHGGVITGYMGKDITHHTFSDYKNS